MNRIEISYYDEYEKYCIKFIYEKDFEKIKKQLERKGCYGINKVNY